MQALGTQSRRQHHAPNQDSDPVICDHGLGNRDGGTEKQSELQHGTPQTPFRTGYLVSD
jgi:putative hemolysin